MFGSSQYHEIWWYIVQISELKPVFRYVRELYESLQRASTKVILILHCAELADHKKIVSVKLP